MNDSTCRWPECERPARTRTYCQRDYYRAKTEGNFVDPWLTWIDKTHIRDSSTWNTTRTRPSVFCRWPECGANSKQNGMCHMHYARAFRMGNLVDPWLTWQKHPACTQCGTAFNATRTTQRFCTTKCSIDRWRLDNPDRMRELSLMGAHVRRARKRALPQESFTVHDVRMASGDDCYLCGKRINFKLKRPNPLSPSLDHVTPISRGGGHILSNAAMTHLVCNMSKGVKEAPQLPLPTIFTP